MKKYDTFIFDLDGTLVHTMPEHRYTVIGQTLKDLGVFPPRELIDRVWFESGRSELIKEQFGLDPVLFWRTYNIYDTPELRKQFTKPYNDVGFIQELKKEGCKIGIVTGAPLRIAPMEIDMLGKENFDAIVVAHSLNGFRPKPDPHGIEECLELLKSKKSESVYIGNADEDVETAQNAGILDILLDRGEHVFPSVNPSLKINSLYELRQLI